MQMVFHSLVSVQPIVFLICDMQLCVFNHRCKYVQPCCMCKQLTLQCHQNEEQNKKERNIVILVSFSFFLKSDDVNYIKRSSVNARQEMCVPAATEQLAVWLWNVREEARVITPAGRLGICQVFPPWTRSSFLFPETSTVTERGHACQWNNKTQ